MMKNRMIKAIVTMVLAMMLALNGFSGAFSSLAATESAMEGVVDFNRGEASIIIQGNEGQSLKGKIFHIYQLLYAENAADLESVHYTMNPKFQGILQNIVSAKKGKAVAEITEYEIIDFIESLRDGQEKSEGNSAFRYFIEELRDAIAEADIEGDVVHIINARSDNSVLVEGLEYGYYIVDEITGIEETDSAASLCMVDTAAPTAEFYVKSDYPTIIHKIQEDDDKSTVGNDGWNDIADYEIGQEIPYKCESNIPNMNGYDTYYYAWHGVLNEAITFQEDGLSITLYQETEGVTESYVLKEQEFQILQNVVDETFVVQIQDIKSIVDREFGQEEYGQRVVLTYSGILNEKAGKQTGRPGFEQDVRLEFSNDPDSNNNDSTGYTPWDTTVCFTYRLNVKKVNDQGTMLANAKFKLYSDDTCTQEVLVEKTENGYKVTGEKNSESVEMISGSQGDFYITGLDDGTYYLKETQAPVGYRKLADPIKIELSATMNSERNQYIKGEGATQKTLVELTGHAIVKDSTIALSTDVEDGAANLTVINTVGKKLPITGSVGMLLLIGTGLVLLALALKKQNRKTGA